MGRDKHEKHKHQERLPPFVPLLLDTIDSPAWRALSHGAKSLYISLRRRFNIKVHNNGRIFLPYRKAQEELRSNTVQIARWFRELQHYGFIVLAQPGSLGVGGKGKAPHWRLTELGWNQNPPTRDFLRWDGRKFVGKEIESRTGKAVRTAPEKRGTRAPEKRCAQRDEYTRKPVHIVNAERTGKALHI
jgi:hypothetical protein